MEGPKEYYMEILETPYIYEVQTYLYRPPSVFDSGQENDRRWNKISQHIVEMNRFNSACMCSCVDVIGSE